MSSPAPAASAATVPILQREEAGPIALLTLNRPHQRNALSEEMLHALDAAFGEIGADRRFRAVVIAANGPAFCAGHDLKEITARRADPDGGKAFTQALMGLCSRVMQAIVALPQPVIAAVEGTATAAGCQLVASCDLAIAGAHATFATPGVQIGLFCSTPMVALSRNVARKHAMEMLLTGDAISAEEAARIGLVNRVVAVGAAREEALKLAQRIAARSAIAVRYGKAAFYRQLEFGLAEAYRFTSDVMVENMMARDAAEGIGAFLEKRAPEWDK